MNAQYNTFDQNTSLSLSQFMQSQKYIELSRLLDPASQKIRLYRERHFMLLVFFLSLMMNTSGWITYAPLADIILNTYGVSIFAINYMSEVFLITFIPINFIAVRILDNHGLKIGITIGMILTTFGFFLRCFINRGFFFAYAGQFLLAVGCPFMYNAPTKLSANWYGEDERVISTTIGAYATCFGIAVGYLFPSLFVDNSDLTDSDSAKQHIFKMSFYLALISFGVTLLVIGFLKDKPPTPPAFTQVEDEDTRHESLFRDMWTITHNRNYLLSSIGSACTIAYFLSFTALLSYLTDITTKQGSILGLTQQLAGISGGVIVSIYVTYTKKFKLTAQLVGVMNIFSYVVVCFAIWNSSFIFLIIAIFLNAFLGMGIISVAYEMGVEQTYPIGEATSHGFINTLINLFGFIIIVVLTFILKYAPGFGVFITAITLGMLLLLGLGFLSAADIELKRCKEEMHLQEEVSIIVEELKHLESQYISTK